MQTPPHLLTVSACAWVSSLCRCKSHDTGMKPPTFLSSVSQHPSTALHLPLCELSALLLFPSGVIFECGH
ncbi:unnamed protein product [Knipowitschia caucasica]